MFHIWVFTLFFAAIFCFILKQNFLMYFIGLELIVLGINLQVIYTSLNIDNSKGLFLAVILLAIAAIDTAIGLSLLIKYFNITGRIEINSLTMLKG